MKRCKHHGWLESHNVYTRPDGRAECRLCQREAMRQARDGTRRTQKQYLAEKTGMLLPLAATSPRQHRRRSDALLTRRQVLAAYEIYKAGMSVRGIATLGWEKWGYKSMETAARTLDDSFRLEGLRLRSPGEGKRLAEAGKACAECGGGREGFTVGCKACSSRHRHRRYRNEKAARPSEERRAA